MQETQEMGIQPLGQEGPLEESMATHSSVLAWIIPRTGEPGELQSMGSQRVGHDCSEWACRLSILWNHCYHDNKNDLYVLTRKDLPDILFSVQNKLLTTMYNTIPLMLKLYIYIKRGGLCTCMCEHECTEWGGQLAWSTLLRPGKIRNGFPLRSRPRFLCWQCHGLRRVPRP